MVVNANVKPDRTGILGKIFRRARDFATYILNRATGSVDLTGKLILIDNDELILVWENGLRERRITKEKEAWKSFEREFGQGAPEVVDAFLKFQEQLYAYIELEKDRFLKERQGSRRALGELLRSGAKTIVVTKGAKPYTQKCFDLLGLSPSITNIYSPVPGSREKRFVDAVRDHGKNTSRKCLKDTIIVGHDLDNDMAWDLVPLKGHTNDGNAPVFILFDALAFDKEVDAPLDALPDIMALLVKRGNNDFLKGFKAIRTPEQARTRRYSFKLAFYHHPKRNDKTRIPVIYGIKKRQFEGSRLS